MIDFNKKEFEKLADHHDPHCVSIFIPTHRAGQEVNQGVDMKILKNQLKKVEKQLKDYQLSDNEISSLLEPAEMLLDDIKFWKYQSDGLAIFLGKDFFKYYTLPVYFEEYIYVADHFYLKPLVPLFNSGGEFYILALSQKDVKLFQGFPFQIDELVVEDLLPEKLEEAVGFDYEQKSLQFRAGQEGTEKGMFHGQGEGKDDKKEEILKYFRAVNKGVMSILHDSKAPLIIAAVDYLIPIYLEANEYKYVHDEHITGNPEQADPVLLHEKAMDLLKDHFDTYKNEKLGSFEKKLSDAKASFREEKVIPAAINGRVDTLFLRNRASLWGTFEKNTNSINTEEESSTNNADLLNIAAIKTINQGGAVYLLEEEEMPEPNTKANAILRY